jgi:DNA polymerase-1
MKMRRTGCKIDTKVRDRNALHLHNEIEEKMLRLKEKFGDFNPNSTKQLADIWDENEMDYILTEKGNPSIKNEHLQNFFDKDDPYNEEVSEKPWVYDLWRVRKGAKVRDTFLLGSYVDFLCEGDLIHPSIYATKIENVGGGVNGTKSGRLAMAKPNGQQIPALGVDTELGTYARQPWVPFEDCWWGKIDYSQIEYRFTAHFASGEGSEAVRQAYITNPDTDYHQIIIDLTKLKRRFAKNLNFGVAYGMGAKTMSVFFGWTLDYCYDVLKIYHSKAPYVKHTSNQVEKVALRRGYIKTFLGRRARLINKNKAYTMFCRLISGSAADLMKKSLHDIDKAGVFDVLYPHLTVHDEIDVSIPKTKEGIEAFLEMDYIMNNCIKIKVPIKTEAEYGKNWADIEPFDKEVALKSI